MIEWLEWLKWLLILLWGPIGIAIWFAIKTMLEDIGPSLPPLPPGFC